MALSSVDLKTAQPGDYIEFKEQKVAEIIEQLGEDQDYSCRLKLKMSMTIQNEPDLEEGKELEIWYRKIPKTGIGSIVKMIDGKVKNTITFNHHAIRLKKPST